MLEYSQNYSVTSGGLWNYYRDEIDDADYNAADDKQFKYKTKIIEKQKKELHDQYNQHQMHKKIDHHDKINHQCCLYTQKSLLH